MAIDRLDKLRRDPAHLDSILSCLARVIRRRAHDHAYTNITAVMTDGVVTDIKEDRRWRAEEFDPEKL